MRQDHNNNNDIINSQVAHVEDQGTKISVGGVLLKNFMALCPLEFSVGVDVTEAKNQLLAIEKHLRLMGCTDTEKVQLGTFLLRGDIE